MASKNTHQTIADRSAMSKWPSGTHVADFQLRDGAIVVALDFSGLTDGAIVELIENLRHEQERRAR